MDPKHSSYSRSSAIDDRILNIQIDDRILNIQHNSELIQHTCQKPFKSSTFKMNIVARALLQNHTATGAMHDSRERYDAPKCHKDTRKAVLNDISGWALEKSQGTRILWLTGPAGAGKSAILQTIAAKFQKSRNLAASFFFSRTAAKRNTEACLIPTIAYQLMLAIPASRQFIEQAVTEDMSIFDKVLSVQINKLIVQPLIRASLHPESGSHWPSLLVIDGLDECQGDDAQIAILSALKHAIKELEHSLPKLHVLVASRPEPIICDAFQHNLEFLFDHVTLDNSYQPDQDIVLFLRSAFADIYRRRHGKFPSLRMLQLSWPSDETITFLVKKSSGHFIYPATVIKFVDADRKVPTAQLKIVMDISTKLQNPSNYSTNPFVVIENLYTHILESCQEQEQLLDVLGAILFLSKPPTAVLLEELLGLASDDVSVIFWDVHSIIHIPSSRTDAITFHHASFGDFLVDHKRSRNFYIDAFKAHSFLLEACLRRISEEPLRCNLLESRTPALEYSICHWSDHYIQGDGIRAEMLDNVLQEFNLTPWADSCLSSCSVSSNETTEGFISLWNSIAPAREQWHRRVCYSIYCP